MDKLMCLTIGNFDGLHTGHLKLIGKVVNLSEKYGLTPAVYGFDANTKNNSLIFPQNQLRGYLKELGVKVFEKLNFVGEIKGLSCEEFIIRYIAGKASYVVVGENFCFGENKSGGIQTLKGLGGKYNFKTVVLKLRKSGGGIISSSYIRALLSAGKIPAANKLMYKNFTVFGTVKDGFKIGGSILNIPTANIGLPKNTVSLPYGVYKTVTVIDKVPYDSITNIGVAPINPKKKPLIETFIFDFSANIYKKRISVEFVKYIRKERKFKNIDALRAQIERDIHKARETKPVIHVKP